MINQTDYVNLKKKNNELEQKLSSLRAVNKKLSLPSSVVEQSEESIAFVSLKGDLLFLNPAFANMHGYTVDELIGKTVSVFHSEDQMPEVHRANKQIKETGNFVGEIWHVKRDGTPFLTHMNNSLFYDQEGNPAGIIGTMHDITARKRAEKALKESESRLRGIFDNAPFTIVYLDKDFRSLQMNPLMEQLVNCKSEDVQGKYCYDVWGQYAKDDTKKGKEKICDTCQTAQVLRDGKTHTHEQQVGDKYFKIIASPVLDVHGHIIGALECAADITERKLAEDKLQLFRQLVDHANDAVFVIDLLTGDFLDVNQRCCDSLQYSRTELCHMGVTDIEMSLPDDYSWQEHLRKIKDHSVHLLEGTHRRKDGTKFPVEVNVNYIQLADREYMVSVARDVSERKSAEKKLLRSMKELREVNIELEQFSYVMAHDLKAPIRAITNYASFLQEDLAESLTGNQKMYLDRLKETTVETGRMVEDLLSLARISHVDIEKKPLDLGIFLKNLASSMKIGSDIQIDLADDCPTIDSDAGLLRQVFQNLIDNALKYNISTVKHVELACLPAVDGGVECFVRDNGIGISAQYQKQIFRMFERLHTRREYSGSGVGLAIVKRAVERLGGTIRLESTPGKGSTFYVSLPITMAL